jgi:hypothetical protein
LKFFPIDTKFFRLSTLVHLGNCVTADKNLRKKLCGMALELCNLEIKKAAILEIFLVWKNPQQIIHEMRQIWNSENSGKKLDIFSKQRIFSLQTNQLLNFLLQEAIKLAGPRVDENNFFGLMAIGSTSRCDRSSFSDIELFVLFQSEKGKEQSFRSYLYFLFSIFEFLIIRVGEWEFGFQIDKS